MACGGDDDGCVDGVGVHAGLVVVVHGDEGPVGYDAGDLDLVTFVARDEVFDGGGVELKMECVSRKEVCEGWWEMDVRASRSGTGGP